MCFAPCRSGVETCSCDGVGLEQHTPLPHLGQDGFQGVQLHKTRLSVRITQLYWELGLGCPVRDHQNIKNGLSITHCRPSRTMALPQRVQTPPSTAGASLRPCPLPHAHGQLSPGAPTHRSARAGIPLPGCEGLGIFKAVKCCILAQKVSSQGSWAAKTCVASLALDMHLS